MKIFIATLLMTLTVATGIEAQKFGHVNSSELIVSLPEVKVADSQVEAYQNQLIKRGEEMVATFQKEYDAYGVKANAGELSAIQMQQEEARLSAQQQEIQMYEVEVQQLLATKRQEVYQPILDKVQKVVEEVGKELGYTMVFDSGSGGLLFVQNSDDLMSVVKQRLGITN